MTPGELLDQKDRNTATGDLDRTLFVEASAGTGKTTMLVDRVVNLITTGTATMEQIAAITFTEAAAAELRDRLAERFERQASEQGDERAQQALEALDASAVTTLHGFARRILVEQPFAVGLPPLFDIMDRSSSLVSFDERWQRFAITLLESPLHQELMVRALSCGVTLDALRQVALVCEENWDRLDERGPIGPAPAMDGTALIELLTQAMARRPLCTDPEDLLCVFLSGTVDEALGAVSHSRGEIDLLQILAGLPKLTSARGRKGNWVAPDGTEAKEDVLDLLRAAEAERLRLLGDTEQWALSGLLGHIVGFTRRAADERRASGRLSFLDLLVLARNLVDEHAEARAELHRRYCHILIDEFQDTDPLQAELAMYLATASVSPGHGDWSTFEVPPGRLFFVGDPKQSIYRFRRADVELFLRIRNHVVDQPLQLQTNFRSRPGIVQWVNAAFSALFGSGEPGKQPEYQPLIASEDQGEDNRRGLNPVIFLGRDPVAGTAGEVRAAEARDVVAAIATMHREGWTLSHNGSAMSYSDVTVLVPARTGLPVLEAAFQTAGIPCRLESSSLVYESGEVQQLLAILRAVDDPTDALSVLAALRSPAFGCGDDDLFLHHALGGGWDPRRGRDDGTPVADALAAIGEMHATSRWQTVSELVSGVVEDRRLMSLSLDGSRARESWRRIRFVMDQARLFDEVNGGDLRSFLRWVGHQEQDEANVTEAILPESDDDAVRITTIHAAKGLEYPVVVLLGLGTPPRAHPQPMLFTPSGPEFHLTGSLETPGYPDALEYEKDMDAYERRRLLYVAATRARDVLLVSAHRKEKKDDQSLAAQIVAATEGCPELWSDGRVLCEVTEPVAVTRQPDPPTDDEAGRAAFKSSRARLIERERQPRTVAATGVAHLAESSVELGTPAFDGDTDAGGIDGDGASSVHRRGRAGTSVGRAVHAVLQVIDLESGEGLDALARAQAVAEGVAERHGEVRDLVRSALESDLVRQATAGGRYWREVYVGVPVGDRVLEGFIDLLFETPDGLHVVDYKTDRTDPDEGATEIARRYRLQGASYALAVGLALDRPVSHCDFLVLRANGALAVPLGDLAAAVEQARDLLSHPIPA